MMICIKNEEFRIENEEFALKMMKFADCSGQFRNHIVRVRGQRRSDVSDIPPFSTPFNSDITSVLPRGSAV